MLYKNFFLTALCCFFAGGVLAQTHQMAVYSGIFSVAGIDYRWCNPKRKPDFAASVGFGAVFTNSVMLEGGMLFYKKHSLFVGFNLLNIYDRYVGKNWSAITNEPSFYDSKTLKQFLSFPIGYRFQTPTQRFFLQVSASPINLDWENSRFIGMSNVRSYLDLRIGANLNKKDEKDDIIDRTMYFDTDSTQKITLQHSIYITNPIILALPCLGYDVRLHGLGLHDIAFGINASTRFNGLAPISTANFSGTILFGKNNIPFEIGLNYGLIHCYQNLESDLLYASVSYKNTFIGLPLGFRYQSAKGDIFAKIGIMPYWYFNEQQTSAFTQNYEIRTYSYGNDLLNQVQAQIAIGYSFRKK